MQYEEGSGENDVFRTDSHPEFRDIERAYDRDGKKMLYNNYRQVFENESAVTRSRAKVDLRQGLTLRLAEQLCSKEEDQRVAAAYQIYYQAGMFRARGHH